MDKNIILEKEIEYANYEILFDYEVSKKQSLTDEEIKLSSKSRSLSYDRKDALFGTESFIEFLKDYAKDIKNIFAAKELSPKIMHSLLMFAFGLASLQTLIISPIQLLATYALIYGAYEGVRAIKVKKVKQIDTQIELVNKELDNVREQIKNFQYTFTPKELAAMKRQIVELRLQQPTYAQEQEEIMEFVEKPKTLIKKR